MQKNGKRSSRSHTHTRFVLNIRRVKLLIDLDKQHLAETKYRDILRAAVVLLHSSLEDAMRNLIHEALPTANEKLWEKITFLADDGVNTKPAISVSELRKYKDKKVQDLIDERIDAYLNRRSFSNIRDFNDSLKQLGLPVETFQTLIKNILPMVERRHLIVHQSDRMQVEGHKYGNLRNIEHVEVLKWTARVERLLKKVFSEIAQQRLRARVRQRERLPT